MMYYIKLGGILLIISVIATGILAYVNSVTEPKIIALKAAEAVKSREALIPGADFEEVKVSDDFSYFIAYKKGSKELLGYTFTAGKTGYSSKVLTMAGLDPQFNIINIKVIDQAETPGLGANCTAPSFSDQFKGKTQEQMLVDKDGGPIKSLSGATITTRAIANSLMEQIQVLKKDVDSHLRGNDTEIGNDVTLAKDKQEVGQ